MKRSGKISSLVLILCFMVGAMAGCSFWDLFKGGDDNSNNVVVAEPLAFNESATWSDVATAYLEATVSIRCKTGDSTYELGSGVFIHECGYFVTNNHVVDSATSKIEAGKTPYVVYHHGSDNECFAKLLWSSKELDMAILKCPCTDCSNNTTKYAKMENRLVDTNFGGDGFDKVKYCEQVLAIGTPINFSLRDTCTLGIASGFDRYSASGTGENMNVYEGLFQHTASINHGNSGGPLIDKEGNLIGLNTLGKDDAQDIYFAIPILPAMLIIDKIVACYESNPNTTYSVPKLNTEYYDALEDLHADSPHNFNAVGLKVSTSVGDFTAGDIIKSIKIGEKIYTTNTRNDMIYALMNAVKGQKVMVNYTSNIGVTNLQKTVTLIINEV